MEQNKNGFVAFLRLLGSWIVLPIMYYVVYFVGSLCSRFLLWVISEISVLSAFMKIILIIVGGSFFLGIIILPLFFGAAATVFASEKVYPSKNGTRYIVFSVILMTLTVVGFLMALILRVINWAAIYVVVYCILVIAFRQKRLTQD